MIIPILIGVTLLLFMLLSLMKGDPSMNALGAGATAEQLEMFREENGLNAPLFVQYLSYIANAARGDLGTSYVTRQSVSSMIAVRAPNTLFVALSSMAFTIIVALILGIAMAVKQNSIFDNFMRVFTVIMTSMPQFWLALMLIMLFCVYLGWLPSSGLDTGTAAILPIFCMACGGITICARIGRSSLLDVLNQDYIRTARAKGLTNSYIVRRHALKNALLPMVTVYGRIISTCMNGSVVIETVFGINGIGTMLINALRQKDVPAIMGGVIITTCVIAVVNLITDIFYAFIDPRIKSMYVRHKIQKKAVEEEKSANVDK